MSTAPDPYSGNLYPPNLFPPWAFRLVGLLWLSFSYKHLLIVLAAMNHVPVWRMFGPISFALLDLVLCLLLMATPMRFRRLLQLRILFGLSYGLTLAIPNKTEIAGAQLPLSLILAGFLGRPCMVRGCVFFILLFVYALVSISICVHRCGY